MRMNNRRLFGLLLLALMVFLCSGCFWKKAKFDPQGHEYAVTLQKEALTLIGKASVGESFDTLQVDVFRLMTEVEEAYEHARTIRKNDAVTGLWDLLRNPEANRLGKFMALWRVEGILKDKEYVETAKKFIDDEFKLIIQLEEEKKK